MKKAILFSMACLGTIPVWAATDGVADPNAAHDSEKAKNTAAQTASWNVMTPTETLQQTRFPNYDDYENAAQRIMMSDNRAYLNGDTGNAFAVAMTLHHQMAILTSVGIREITKDTTKDTSVAALAQSIVSDQTREVKEMQALISSGKLSGNTSPKFEKRMNDIMADMMKQMATPQAGTSVEKATRSYLENMIAHHEAAIDMAKAYLESGKDESLLKLSRNVVQAQTAEITLMKAMLR